MTRAKSVKSKLLAKAAKNGHPPEPTIEKIRLRAYEIYVSRGGAPGDELQDWLKAEQELRANRP